MDRAAWREWYEETYLHTAHWHEVQKHVYGRNNGNCERCDKADMEHVHHCHYYSLWHELDDPTSVVGVCAECHAYLHGHSTYDPAASEPNCVDCGWPAEAMTDDEEPICKDCRVRRFAD